MLKVRSRDHEGAQTNVNIADCSRSTDSFCQFDDDFDYILQFLNSNELFLDEKNKVFDNESILRKKK